MNQLAKSELNFNPDTSVWFKLRVTLAMLCWSVYILWFNFILALKFIFFCFKLIIIHHHTQTKTNKKARIKLNHNIYLDLITYPDLLLMMPKARSCQIRFVHVIACQECDRRGKSATSFPGFSPTRPKPWERGWKECMLEINPQNRGHFSTC